MAFYIFHFKIVTVLKENTKLKMEDTRNDFYL